MNSFIISAILVACLANQAALGQYQQQSQYQQQRGYQSGYAAARLQPAGYQQRKLAPTPQAYGGSQYQQPQQQQQYQAAPVAVAYAPVAVAKQAHYEEPVAVQVASGYQSKASAGYGAQVAPAGAGYGQASAGYAAPKAAKYEEPYYPPMPFAWGYDINDGYGGAQYHKESGDEYGKRTGSYGYTDAYGVYRQVDYVADEHGFRATIKTNEPGTSNESPADVELHAYEPPSNYYTGASNNYQQQASSGYGAAPVVQKAYSAPAAAAYSAPVVVKQAPVYQQQQQVASYQPQYRQQVAVAAPVYQAARAGYEQQGYASGSQYASSSNVAPVYSKPAAATVAVAAGKSALKH